MLLIVNLAARDEKMNRLVNTREDMLQKKAKEAAEHKQRTLDMYDKMAKSAPAGGHKVMNVGLLKNSFDESSAEAATHGAILQQNLVEQAIRDRIKDADERKKKILAAYDVAAKSGPAGSERMVNFESISKEEVRGYELQKPTGACTFGASGGIARVVKGGYNYGSRYEYFIFECKLQTAPDSKPGTPQSDKFAKGSPFEKANEENLDAMQRAIRDRQREAEENKRRTLAAYDAVARAGAGPKQIGVEELRRMAEQ
ncbi:Smoothelin-like protein 1, partial [Leptotrombidium deliense]